jgi:hypothetical protein
MLFNKELLPIYNGYMRGWSWDDLHASPPISSRSFYDHFVANGLEILMLTYQSVAAGAEKILTEHGFKCVFDEINPVKHHEPLFLAYRKTNLENTYKEKHSIVVCAGIKPFYTRFEIKQFCEYYFQQGVEKIFLYCLGHKKKDNLDLLPLENVIYDEWNFYPDRILNRGGFKFLYQGTQMFESFAKKIGVFCDWLILVALDDFITVKSKKKTLKEYLTSLKNPHHIYCPFKHADLQKKQIKINNFSTRCLETRDQERGRSILKGNLINIEHRIRVFQSSHINIDNNLICANIGSSVYNPAEDPRNQGNVIFTRRKFY